MIILFRILGIISVFIALMFLLISGITDGYSGGEIGLIAWSLFWAAVWFYLGHRAARRRDVRIHIALQEPCTHCGSEAGMGYRVCGSCGRVKSPVLL